MDILNKEKHKFAIRKFKQNNVYGDFIIAINNHTKTKTTKYMENYIKRIYNTQPTNLLSESFLWAASPQGHKFWKNIYDKD